VKSSLPSFTWLPLSLSCTVEGLEQCILEGENKYHNSCIITSVEVQGGGSMKSFYIYLFSMLEYNCWFYVV
jgi:hypothetical protein